MPEFYTVEKRPEKNEKHFALKGEWTVEQLSDIYQAIAAENLHKYKKAVFDGTGLDGFDTAAAVCLIEMGKRFGTTVELKNFSRNHRDMFDMVCTFYREPAKAVPYHFSFKKFLITMGRKVENYTGVLKTILALFGEFVYNLIQVGAGAQKMRVRSIVFHLNETGIRALPVIFLMAFAISLVMGYQGATQLRNFGATIYTIDLVTISVLREMGVLLTAIMVAGRTGSAFAAQIGTMKLNQEVDALQTMGVSPFNALVLPRLCAIVLVLPVLTFLANIVALAGLYVFCNLSLDISFEQFMNRLQDVITPAHFWTGIIKAPVFALLIGVIGCMQGMQVGGSAEDVGRHTTYAVVQSIFSVILMDAIFSIIFTRLGV